MNDENRSEHSDARDAAGQAGSSPGDAERHRDLLDAQRARDAETLGYAEIRGDAQNPWKKKRLWGKKSRWGEVRAWGVPEGPWGWSPPETGIPEPTREVVCPVCSEKTPQGRRCRRCGADLP